MCWIGEIGFWLAFATLWLITLTILLIKEAEAALRSFVDQYSRPKLYHEFYKCFLNNWLIKTYEPRFVSLRDSETFERFVGKFIRNALIAFAVLGMVFLGTGINFLRDCPPSP